MKFLLAITTGLSYGGALYWATHNDFKMLCMSMFFVAMQGSLLYCIIKERF